MPPDPDREQRVTFVDDDTQVDPKLGGIPPIQLYEHQLNIGGNWKNWFTCLGAGKCPLCEAGEKPYFAGAYTIIEHSEYQDKKGVTHRNELTLFVCKTEVLRTIKHISKKRGGLKGLVLDIRRAANTDAAVGSHFDYIGRCGEGGLPELPTVTGEPEEKEVKPFDYLEVFKPKSREKIMEIVGRQQIEDDDIPF